MVKMGTTSYSPKADGRDIPDRIKDSSADALDRCIDLNTVFTNGYTITFHF